MKPIQLTMQAFGSYGKKTVIDFTKPNQNLFLITGDTGAGKTTIFDAIVFALYGQASSTSNKKDGVELQSQFADCAVTPFVELTFSERSSGEDLCYTVRRVPRHIRPLKKGSGVKEDRESVSLILPDGTEYSQNRQETNQKLEEIVGLTQSQFMQVAMIAQGEFMDLLRADSNKKKDIFRKLFNTEIYQQIVNELDQRCKSKRNEISRIRTVCHTEIGHIVIPPDSQYTEELTVLKDRILNSDRLNAADMDELLEKLQYVCQALEADLELAQKVCADASVVRDQARDAFHHGKILQGAFDQLDSANRLIAQCDAEKPEMEQKAQLIEKIQAAYDIQAVYERYFDAEKAIQETEIRLREQELLLPSLIEAAQAAAFKEASARTEKDEQLAAFTAISEQVAKALETLKKLRTAEMEVSQKEAAFVQAETRLHNAKTELDTFEQEVQANRQRLEQLSEAKLRMSQWEAHSREATALEVDCQALKAMHKALDAQREKAEKAIQVYAKCREECLEKNQEYTRKRTDFLDAQAGFLAKEQLHPGQPCPVCGSLEHPAPRELSEAHQDLTRELIDELAREAEMAQTRQDEASSEAKSASDLLTEKEANFAKAKQILYDRILQSLPDISPEMVAMQQAVLNWQAQLSAEESTLRSQIAELDRVQAFLKRAEETGSTLRKAAEIASAAHSAANSELAASLATRDSLGKQLDYSSEDDAIAARKAAQDQKDAAEKAYNAANLAADAAKSNQEQAQTRIRQFREAIPGQQAERDQRQSAYQEALTAKQMQEVQWKQITSAHQKAEIVTLQAEIQALTTRRATAEGSRDTALQAIADQPRPVLQQLQEASRIAEDVLREHQDAMEQIREVYKADRSAYDALAPKMEERSRITREFSKVDSLYRRLAGKETGSRMDIETFVQRYYLQRILYAANARFQEMSAGQFELRMTGEEQAGAGKNRGLDLMVYSTVTGKVREVRTLSGGESFMAALSLALGMADQIQESSAAVNLDMMFIDEGFGSLDAHSRDQAVKVLQQMASGSKLIGIISHVTELKHAIEDQLIVSKDETGSHPRWVIS